MEIGIFFVSPLRTILLELQKFIRKFSHCSRIFRSYDLKIFCKGLSPAAFYTAWPWGTRAELISIEVAGLSGCKRKCCFVSTSRENNFEDKEKRGRAPNTFFFLNKILVLLPCVINCLGIENGKKVE